MGNEKADKLFEHLHRWNKWRKRNLNSAFYKFMVLVGFSKSPSMSCVLTDKEEAKIWNEWEKIFKERDENETN